MNFQTFTWMKAAGGERIEAKYCRHCEQVDWQEMTGVE